MQHAVGGLNPEASKMFRVRKTCLKMLTKRGYIVDEEDVNMTTDDFKMKFGDDPSRESLTILVEKADDPTDQLFVFFPTDEKVGVKPIKTYCTRMKEENVLRAVIVVKGRTRIFQEKRFRRIIVRILSELLLSFVNDIWLLDCLCELWQQEWCPMWNNWKASYYLHNFAVLFDRFSRICCSLTYRKDYGRRPTFILHRHCKILWNLILH